MAPVEYPFPAPISSGLHSEMQKDHILNMSPRPNSQHIAQVRKTTSLNSNSNSNRASDLHTNANANANASLLLSDAKSSAELVNEIATLEVEILRLERYLLSLYRTTFQHHLPTKSSNDHQFQDSPTDQVAIQKSSSGTRERHRHRSLADHLGNSCKDDARLFPDRLSQDIIKCISSIYCKLGNPSLTDKGSSTSSFCSSTTFSPRNLSGTGSWSPGEASDFQENGPYVTMVQVLKLCLDDETYSYAATQLQKFRSLVKSLEVVDPMKMRREEKLAFWINIHNALVMHAYLAYGAQQCMKSSSIVKAAYNVGGHCINAYDIQSSILGIRSHYSAPWLHTLVSPGKKLKAGNTKHTFAIEYPEPLVHFALSSGAYSDPAVRIYRANNVFEDLKVAKKEFIQATVYVHRETKIYLPKILCYYAKDMSIAMPALLEVVTACLSEIQQKSIRTCVKGRPDKYVYWLDQSSSFRYLIHNEIAQR